MQELEGAKKVVRHGQKMVLREVQRMEDLQQLLKAHSKRGLHEENGARIIRIVAFRQQHVNQLGEISEVLGILELAKVAHKLYLTEQLDARLLCLIKVRHKFNGDRNAAAAAVGAEHLPGYAFTELTDDIIPLENGLPADREAH